MLFFGDNNFKIVQQELSVFDRYISRCADRAQADKEWTNQL